MWVAGGAAECGGGVDRPSAAERADDQVAQAGHDLWGSAGPQLPGVLGDGHVPDPVQAVLDRPVATDEVGEPGGAALAWGRLVIA